MARFTLPRDLYHGKGALEALKTFEGKRAMICVGGGSMKRFGFLDKAEQYLKEAGMEVELYEGIEPDPSVETVMKGAAAMANFQPDWIIAMGGGSPIDAAKAMWIKYEYPECTFEDMCKVFGLPKLRRKAHFCAVSSTSGTATEVTAFSIITDYSKGIKYPIADFEITPDVAIVDPELAETMPKKLVAHTGMDAMTHAIEAYVSTANCDFTDPLAIHAIEMIMKDLVPSYNGDMAARDRMHNAQCLAGMAFSNALLGIVHSMAHKTGAAFADYGAHIIHGAANAMYLPKVIAFNAKDETAKKRYGVIADSMHLGGRDDDEKVALLIAYLRGMNDELNIPHCHRALRRGQLSLRAGLRAGERVPRAPAGNRPRTRSPTPAPAPTRASRARRRWRSCSSAAITIPRSISNPASICFTRGTPARNGVLRYSIRQAGNDFPKKIAQKAGHRRFVSNKNKLFCVFSRGRKRDSEFDSGGSPMFRIVKKERLNPTVTKMVIDAPFIAKKAEPGQFIILRALEDSERIPLTIADYDREERHGHDHLPDRRRVRRWSWIPSKRDRRLHDFVGPLGVATDTEGLKKVAVVGGGVGCAIALPVTKKLHEQGCEVHAIVGFQQQGSRDSGGRVQGRFRHAGA